MTEAVLIQIAIQDLHPHPDNPRLMMREERIQTIATWIQERGAFQDEYALLVRPHEGAYQIVAGHHRIEAARRTNIERVPCWVRDISDDEAFMLLATSNEQGELTPLELGLHALKGATRYGRNGTGVKAYAEAVGKANGYITELTQAARVYQAIKHESFSQEKLSDKAKHLSAIFHTPDLAWLPLARALVADDWSVKDTAAAVDRVKSLLNAIPAWWQLDTMPLIDLAIRNEAQSITRAITLAREINDSLQIATAYRHTDSGVIEDRDGREYRRFDPVPFEYDQRAAFRDRVRELASIPDANQLRDIQRGILEYARIMADQSVRWEPVLSDDEIEDRRRRDTALAAINQRKQYTPKLLHRDVIEGLRTIGSESIDLIATDPPYNIGKAEWDELGDGNAYAVWARPWLTECRRVLKPTGSMYVFGKQPMLSYVLITMCELGLLFQGYIAWDTIQGAGGVLYPDRHEDILFFTKTASFYKDEAAIRLERHEEHIRDYKGKEYRFKTASNVWRYPCVDNKDTERTEHPTQKPVELMERIIGASCPHGGRVLDCFIGSGTTGVAAMRLERTCIGIDKEQRYIALAEQRFETADIGSALERNEG